METSGQQIGRAVGNSPAKPGILDEADAALEGIAHRFEAGLIDLQSHMDKVVGTAPPAGNGQPGPPSPNPQHKQARLHMTFSRLQNLVVWLEREVERVKQL
jgi:hypothetical protein